MGKDLAAENIEQAGLLAELTAKLHAAYAHQRAQETVIRKLNQDADALRAQVRELEARLSALPSMMTDTGDDWYSAWVARREAD